MSNIGMRGVRLYPAYHGTRSIIPSSLGCSSAAAQRGMLVQIAMRLEDERVHHPAIDVPP